jgi:hypothetical protein
MQRELARHFVMLDQPIAAVEILRKQLTRDSDDPALARELMSVALSAGRLEDARLAARRTTHAAALSTSRLGGSLNSSDSTDAKPTPTA